MTTTERPNAALEIQMKKISEKLDLIRNHVERNLHRIEQQDKRLDLLEYKVQRLEDKPR